MRLLLDTQLVIWAGLRRSRLSTAAENLIEDSGNDLFFSVVTLWEIAIKTGMGKPNFAVDARALRTSLLQNGYKELLIESEHAFSAGSLPQIHKDPFDRMLIAQAQVGGLLLLTADATIARYPGPIQKV